MSRRRYVVAYDICDPRRLRAVHDVVLGRGDPLQYSVFVCDLNPKELIGLKERLRDEMHVGEDSVVLIDLGEVGSGKADCFEFMGRGRDLPPPPGAMIV